MTTDAIVKTIHVDLAPDAAFELFTAKMDSWWPKDRNSVSAGAGKTARSISMGEGVGAEIVEIDADGARLVWGTVESWEPGKSVTMTWHPGVSPDQKTLVSVEFTQDGRGSRIVLTHSGWEAIADGAKRREGFNRGWDNVIAGYLGAA